MPGEPQAAGLPAPSVGSLLKALTKTAGQGKGLVLDLRTGTIKQKTQQAKAASPAVTEASPSDPRAARRAAAAAEPPRSKLTSVEVPSAPTRVVSASPVADVYEDSSSPSASSSSSECAVASEASRSQDRGSDEGASAAQPVRRVLLKPAGSPLAAGRPFNSLAPTPVKSRERASREDVRLTPRTTDLEAVEPPERKAKNTSPARWRPSGDDQEEAPQEEETLSESKNSDSDSSNSDGGGSAPPKPKRKAELLGRRDAKNRRQDEAAVKMSPERSAGKKANKNKKLDDGAAAAEKTPKKRPREEEPLIRKVAASPRQTHSGDPRLAKGLAANSLAPLATTELPVENDTRSNIHKKRKKHKHTPDDVGAQDGEHKEDVPTADATGKAKKKKKKRRKNKGEGQEDEAAEKPATPVQPIQPADSFWGRPLGVIAAPSPTSAMSIAAGGKVASLDGHILGVAHTPASPFDTSVIPDKPQHKKRRKKDKADSSSSSSSGDRRKKRKRSRHRRRRHEKVPVQPPNAWTAWPPPPRGNFPGHPVHPPHPGQPWGWPAGHVQAGPPPAGPPPPGHPGYGWSQNANQPSPQAGSAWAQPAANAMTVSKSAPPSMSTAVPPGAGEMLQPASDVGAAPAAVATSSEDSINIYKDVDVEEKASLPPATASALEASPISPATTVAGNTAPPSEGTSMQRLETAQTLDKPLTDNEDDGEDDESDSSSESAINELTQVSSDPTLNKVASASAPAAEAASNAPSVSTTATADAAADVPMNAFSVQPSAAEPTEAVEAALPAAADIVEDPYMAGLLPEEDPYMAGVSEVDPYMAGLPEGSESSADENDDIVSEVGDAGGESFGVGELSIEEVEVLEVPAKPAKPLDPSLEDWQGPGKTAWDVLLLLELDADLSRLEPPDGEEVIRIVRDADPSKLAPDASDAVEATQGMIIVENDAETLQMPLWGLVGEWSGMLVAIEVDTAVQRDPSKIKSAERRRRKVSHTQAGAAMAIYDVDGDDEVEPNPASPPRVSEPAASGAVDIDATAGQPVRQAVRSVSWQAPPRLDLPKELIRHPSQYTGSERAARASARPLSTADTSLAIPSLSPAAVQPMANAFATQLAPLDLQVAAMLSGAACKAATNSASAPPFKAAPPAPPPQAWLASKAAAPFKAAPPAPPPQAWVPDSKSAPSAPGMTKSAPSRPKASKSAPSAPKAAKSAPSASKSAPVLPKSACKASALSLNGLPQRHPG